MAGRSLPALILDEVATRLLAVMRRRTAGAFSGIVVPVDDLIGRRVMATGNFEATQFEGVATVLDREDVRRHCLEGTFVDVGANIGLYSLALAARFDRCIAIEANPQTFAVLKANLALRDLTNVTALCAAASDTSGEAKIYVPLNGNLGWATLSEAGADGRKAIPVELRTLDNVISATGFGQVTLLKIDVEGHELPALRGARQLLTADGPIVLFEVSPGQGGEVVSLLRDCGYSHFYRFRRGWPKQGGRAARLWNGFRHGLSVLPERFDPETTNYAPLVCAMKQPLLD